MTANLAFAHRRDLNILSVESGQAGGIFDVRRHGAFTFAKDRLLRLAVPFGVAVCGFMPLALYPSWMLGTHNTGFVGFYEHIARIGFQVGPPWFIWVLLLFDLVIALLLFPGRLWLTGTETLTRKLQPHSILAFAAMLVLSALAYLPLLSRFGFAKWTVLFTSLLRSKNRASLCMRYGLWLACSLEYPDFPQGFSPGLELSLRTGRAG